jgi:hypothetical protein
MAACAHTPARCVRRHNLLQRAKTDAFEGLEWDNPDRPEARNLLTIYQCVTGEGCSAVQATAGAMPRQLNNAAGSDQI